MGRLIEQLKERKVLKWLTIYFSTSLTILGSTHLFSIRFNLSSDVFNTILVIIICGLFGISVIAWFHGKEGKQPVRKLEVFYHSIISITGLLFIGLIIFDKPITILPSNAKIIAVLPFENLSDSKEDEYFSDGITEDIITQLSKIGELKVISRTSVMKYKNSKLSIPEIAYELGAGSILEGSVRRNNDQIRIVGQLINAKDDEHIWAETYDRKIHDIFSIQSEVAREIANALRTQLTREDNQRLNQNLKVNVDAYAYYLRGRENYQLFTNDDNERAIELFKKAIEIDSNYAIAYAGLADAYCQRTQRFGYSNNWLDSSITISKIALGKNSKIAEPYKSLGLAYSLKGWYNKALQNYHKALDYNPNYVPAIANIAGLNSWIGRYDAAFPWMVKRFNLNPGSESAYRAFGFLYMGLELDSLAEDWYSKALALNPDNNLIIDELVRFYIINCDSTKAKKLIEDGLKKLPNDGLINKVAGNFEFYQNNFKKAEKYYLIADSLLSDNLSPKTELGFIFFNKGNSNKSKYYLNFRKELDSACIKNGNEDYAYNYDLARINSFSGNNELAFENLQKAFNYGWRNYRLALRDPMFNNLKDDEKFNLLINRVKNKIKEMKIKVLDNLKENPISVF